MPYKNIRWIKLEIRLLNDYRFYTLTEDAQLILLKLFMLAGITNNKIPKDLAILKSTFRSTLSEARIEETLKSLKKNFPKFKETNRFYYFSEWASRHNLGIPREYPGKSQVVPKEVLDKIRIEYIKIRGYKEENLSRDDYARIHKGIKMLLEKTKGDVELVVMAIQWTAKQGYDWTIETVCKKYIDFITTSEAKARLKGLCERIGKPVPE